MGLLDLPAPLFDLVDGAFATLLPPSLRLVLWATLGGAATMLLYRALSPQARIAEAKAAARQSRQALNAYDGDLAGAAPLIRRQLADALRQLRLVLPASLVAILPLLSLLAWADTRYGHHFPAAGDAPAIHASPSGLEGRWLADDDRGPPRIQVRAEGAVVVDQALSAPVTMLHRRHWWNYLLANPAGYLPPDGPVERVAIDLPASRYLPFGPTWARTWLALFIPVLCLVSLVIHRIAGIQ